MGGEISHSFYLFISYGRWLFVSSFWCTTCQKMFNQSRQQRTDQAREVASILINNSADYTSQPQQPARYNINNMPVSLHDSVRHNEEYLHETLAAGSSRDGRISAVRRFFCLFVTFDLLFTSLLWIICIIVVWTRINFYPQSHY